MAILRCADVLELTGLSRTTLWRMEAQGLFPQRVTLGTNSVGWLSDEVDQWLATRPRRRTRDFAPGDPAEAA